MMKTQKRDNQQFLSLGEVQALLGIKSRKTIRKYIDTGELSAYKLGGTRWRVSQVDIETFLEKHRISHRLA